MTNYPNPHSDDDREFEQPTAFQQERELELERERLWLAQQQMQAAEQSVIELKLKQGIYYLVGALELLLGLRFILRLMGANPDNTFAQFIYSFSNPFVAPISTLFVSPTLNDGANILDLNLLIAMLAYLLLMGLAVWLVQIIFSR